MARESLVLAGGIVGYMVGGPWGAAIGMALGGLVGSLLFPPDPIHTEGPRLGDLKVTVSTWGVPVTILLGGSMRMAGNVIWSTDFIETAHTTNSGGMFGKGAPPQTATSYTYSINMAVSLCEGEIFGIRRIWANGQLIYSIADGIDQATSDASALIENLMTTYTGTETQLPDAVIEATKGVGNVPGYRGLAYIVFEGFQLADYGNRIPNLEFEVVKNGTYAPPVTSLIGVGTDLVRDPVTGNIWTCFTDNANAWAKVYSANTGALLNTVSIGPGGAATIIYVSGTRKMWVSMCGNSYTTGNVFTVIDPDTYTVSYSSDTDYGGAVTHIGTGMAYNPDKGHVYVPVCSAAGAGILAVGVSDTTMTRIGMPTTVEYIVATNWIYYNIPMPSIHRIAFAGYGNWLLLVDTQNGNIGSSAGEVVSPIFTGWPQQARLAYDSKRNKVFWGDAAQDGIHIVDPVAITISVALASVRPMQMWYDPAADVLRVDRGGNIYSYDPVTYALVETLTGYGQDTMPHAAGRAICDEYGTAFATGVTANPDSYLWKYSLGKRINNGAMLLSEMVSELCVRSDLTPAQIDVTQLTDWVDGYAILRSSTARAALLPLQKSYFFDAVESDDKLKFVKRGGVATVINTADLGAHEGESNSNELLTIQRMQEVELPEVINVNFYNRDADYQTASEISRRLVTASKQQVVEELAITLSPAKAVQIADTLMYDAHVGRTGFHFTTTRKYAKYEPTDVFSIMEQGITYRIRAITKQETGGLIKWTGMADDSSIITSSALSATVQTESILISNPGLTRAEYLDIPIIRDDDDDSGFYLALGGYVDAWNGATAFRSSDAATYTSLGAVTAEATMGSTTTALTSWPGMNFPDELSTVTVFLTSGALSSITYEAMVAGGNACVIGDEIVYFRDATLIAADTYTLTGFMRGRFGTDQYLSAHVAGERFVLLTTAGMLRPDEGLSGVNALRYYKPVTSGRSLSAVAAHSFTNTAAGLKPLAPVHLAWARNETLNFDYMIKWQRCGRLDTVWRDLTDVSMEEDTELYSILIEKTSNGAQFFYTSTTKDFNYTYAMQTANGVFSQFSVIVCQVSAQVGKGFEAEVVVPQWIPPYAGST